MNADSPFGWQVQAEFLQLHFFSAPPLVAERVQFSLKLARIVGLRASVRACRSIVTCSFAFVSSRRMWPFRTRDVMLDLFLGSITFVVKISDVPIL